MSVGQFFKLEHQIFKNFMSKTKLNISQFQMEKSISKIDKFILEFNNEFIIFINKNKISFQSHNCSIDMQLKHLKLMMHYFDYKNGILSICISLKTKLLESEYNLIRTIMILDLLCNKDQIKADLNGNIIFGNTDEAKNESLTINS